MGSLHAVRVVGIPRWVSVERLLGECPWHVEGSGLREASARLSRADASDLAARLRGVGVDGRQLVAEFIPPLPRAAIRAARLLDARRRRETTPLFERKGVRIDRASRVGATAERLAMDVARPWRGRKVVDAACGAGGNAIAFARAGCRVVAIEQDPHRIAMARHNAAVYGVFERIEFRIGDAVSQVETLSGDVIFIDAPWGVSWNRACTGPHDLPLLPPLLESVQRTRGFAHALIKVPPSFKVATVAGAVPEAFFGEADGDHRRIKFVLLTVDL